MRLYICMLSLFLTACHTTLDPDEYPQFEKEIRGMTLITGSASDVASTVTSGRITINNSELHILIGDDIDETYNILSCKKSRMGNTYSCNFGEGKIEIGEKSLNSDPVGTLFLNFDRESHMLY